MNLPDIESTQARKSAIRAFLRTSRMANKYPPIERNQADANLLMSYGQERLWVLDQLGAGAAYNVSVAIFLEGTLDHEALQRSFDKLINRHAILRTRFAKPGEAAVQHINAASGLPIQSVDFSSDNDGPQEQQLRSTLAHELATPFDLVNGPVLRAKLIRMGAQTHVLVMTVHHIAWDAWSGGIFGRELVALYRAYSEGIEPQLPELQIQYADFASWQRKWLTNEATSDQLKYWADQLEGAPALSTFPSDQPRPAVQTFAGASYMCDVPESITNELRDLGLRAKATLFMTLVAAFSVLLSRYARQEDICLGTPIANRNSSEVESLVGFFVNTLVLRTHVDGGKSFLDFLQHVKRTALNAYANQEVSFEQVVNSIKPTRSLSHSPLFQILITLQNAPMEPLAFPGLCVSMELSDSSAAKFDVSASFTEVAGSLKLCLQYNTDLFGSSTIERMGRHFVRLLEGVVTDPSCAVEALPMLDEGERRRILVDWNATAVTYPQTATIHEAFEEQVRRTPEQTAVIYEGQSLSYRELNLRANQLARHLRSLGVGPDMLVGLCMERSVEMIVSLVGVLKAGGAYVPIDPSHPKERIGYMLDDARPAVVLTQQSLIDATGLDMDGSFSVVCLDRQADELEGYSNSNLDEPHQCGNLAYVIYTSGSTGRPKGVGIDHRGIVNRLQWMQETYRLTPADRVLQKTPFSFDVSVWEFFWPLMNGATLVVARPGGHQDVGYLSQVIAQQGITTIHFVPPMLDVFLGVDQSEHCRSLRRVICSGQALPAELQNRFYAQMKNCALHNLYGPTEASVDVTYWECQRDSNSTSVPIGFPIANTQIHILDGLLNPVPDGVVGELHIAGIGLARAYINKPELTAEKFIPNPYGSAGSRMYKTGDLARYMQDGRIEYLGRLDDQVKLRGFRIELGEIEATLMRIEQVREAVVLAREEASVGKYLVAYLVGHEGDVVPESSQLRAILQQSLPDYMAPSHFVTIASMPLTSNGKVDRKALPAPVLTRDANDYVAPATATEIALAGIWADILKVDRVGLHDNFFALGGHSLLAIQLFQSIKKQLAVSLPLATAFSASTVSQLASIIDSGKRSSSLLVPLKTQASGRPLFCVHPIGGQVFFYQKLATALEFEMPVYGIQSPEIAGLPLQLNILDEVVSAYCNAIIAEFPQGPYRLLGWSSGGRFALAVASKLETQGKDVEYVCLIDTQRGTEETEVDEVAWFNFSTSMVLASIRGKAFTLNELNQMEAEIRHNEIPISELFSRKNRGFALSFAKKWTATPIISDLLEEIGRQGQITRNHMTMLHGVAPSRVKAAVHRCWATVDPIPLTYRNLYQNEIDMDGDAHAIQVDEIDGDHYTILGEPNVQDLGIAILKALGKINDSRSSCELKSSNQEISVLVDNYAK